MNEHKHAALIKAWADNQKLIVQYKRNNENWEDCNGFPGFHDNYEYRIKPAEPEKVYLVTSLTIDDASEILQNSFPSSGLRNLANAAIRRAIDDGQVVIPDSERDMSVEKAVRTHICVRGTPTDLVLSEIIAGVK